MSNSLVGLDHQRSFLYSSFGSDSGNPEQQRGDCQAWENKPMPVLVRK